MQTTTTKAELTAVQRARLRLDANRNGGNASDMSDDELVQAYERKHGAGSAGGTGSDHDVQGEDRGERDGGQHGTGSTGGTGKGKQGKGDGAEGDGAEGDGAEGDGAEGDGADVETDADKMPESGEMPDLGANDNPLDQHIREIARQEDTARAEALMPVLQELVNRHAKLVRAHVKLCKQVAGATGGSAGSTITIKQHGRVDVHVDNAHQILPDVLAKVSAGVNTFLVGPAGCGKTTIAEQIAEALGLEFGMTGAVLQEHKLFGFMNPVGEYVETEFYRRYRDGGLFLFDEIDGSSASVLLTANAALAGNRADFPCGMVRKHPDFVCIAAANTFGRGADLQYIGRSQLDKASLDRFSFLTMDYDESVEAKWSGNVEWTKHVQKIRAAVRALGIQLVVSPRASIGGARELAGGSTFAKCEESWIWRGLDKATVSKIKARAGI